MLPPKKNSCKEFHNEKKFLRLDNPLPPPHNFSYGPSLIRMLTILLFSQVKLIYFPFILSQSCYEKSTDNVLYVR